VGVIDELGRVLAAREFSNDERGHDSLLGRSRRRWAKRKTAHISPKAPTETHRIRKCPCSSKYRSRDQDD
jgi:hypothetical protein